MGNRRLKVFISSRMEELAPERKVIKDALDALEVDAWVFEIDAGARSKTAQQTYLEEVNDADIYLGVFWKGYGCYTIEEFEHAQELGKPCLIYEKRTELEGRDGELKTFLDQINQVETGYTIKYFNTPEELRLSIRRDIAAIQTEVFRQYGGRQIGGQIPLH